MVSANDSNQPTKKNVNKFAMIKVLADRVRQLEMGAPSMVEQGDCSHMETAISEFRQGKIHLSAEIPVQPTPADAGAADTEDKTTE